MRELLIDVGNSLSFEIALHELQILAFDFDTPPIYKFFCFFDFIGVNLLDVNLMGEFVHHGVLVHNLNVWRGFWFSSKTKPTHSLFAIYKTESHQFARNLFVSEEIQMKDKSTLPLENKIVYNISDPPPLSQVNYFSHYEKQFVAKSLCEKGFGLLKLREYADEIKISFTEDKRRYKPLAVACVNQTFRRLEEFLQKECGRNVSHLSSRELRVIHSVLLNCRIYFSNEECNTFIKFMKFAFDLGSVSISQEAAFKLYLQIQKNLRSRLGVNQLGHGKERSIAERPKRERARNQLRYLNQRLDRASQWNRDQQLQLIEAYLSQHAIFKIRDYFRMKYSNTIPALFDDPKTLNSRLHKIIRISIKRVQKAAKDHSIPSEILKNINEIKVKIILRSKEAHFLRETMAQLYKEELLTLQTTQSAVKLLNDFFPHKIPLTTRKSGVSPIISTTTEKIRHNMKETKLMLNSINLAAKFSDDRIVMRGLLGCYQHIVSGKDGSNLHYFRKVGSRVKRQFETICKQEGLGATFTQNRASFVKLAQQANVEKGYNSNDSSLPQLIVSDQDNND